ncbi:MULTISPECIES: helix-turn-helix transcriptional regulator [unclassified Bradyrhizobium]|uniref:helix-turn-helix domain-containing protein n=1 Tax=unclassified Bradyrhizobium TaxID=2631580 RepID=UPI002916483C|nr:MULTISPECIES: helix-turn-helix transcriptional regulator [unclassified Bradyrhizobium]
MPAPSSAAMPKPPSKPQLPQEVLERIERLRRVQALLKLDTQKAFTDRLGISPQRWANFVGGMPLSIDVAQKLVRIIPGLTLDWLYNGERRGLSVDLDRALNEPKPGQDRARA